MIHRKLKSAGMNFLAGRFGQTDRARKLTLLVAVVLLTSISGYIVVMSRAAGVAVSVEAENGTLAGAAAVGTDSNASGGKYVQFGTASPSPSPGGTIPAMRGFTENSDGSRDSLFHSLGFTTANSPATTAGLDNAAANGLKALAWVGDYNTSTCQWDQSDSQVTSEVTAIKNHSALLGYYVADEPEQASASCTSMYSQIAARSALIRSIDPNTAHFTIQVISNQGTNLKCYDYEPFMGTTDVLMLDIYPFRQDASYVPCVSDPTHPLTDISNAINAWNTQAADYKSKHPGWTPRYYAMIQDFQDTIWRRPTVTELQQQWAAWQGSGIEGVWYFSWDWQGNSLDGFTDHQCEFKKENLVATSC
jgi:hypothetical protein